jgi:hypothetical protein
MSDRIDHFFRSYEKRDSHGTGVFSSHVGQVVAWTSVNSLIKMESRANIAFHRKTLRTNLQRGKLHKFSFLHSSITHLDDFIQPTRSPSISLLDRRMARFTAWLDSPQRQHLSFDCLFHPRARGTGTTSLRSSCPESPRSRRSGADWAPDDVNLVLNYLRKLFDRTELPEKKLAAWWLTFDQYLFCSGTKFYALLIE